MITGGRLQIAAELNNLAIIRAFVEDNATALGAAPEVVADMVLATDEAATNVIVHGYRGRRGLVEVEVKRESSDLLVLVRDDAPPFDPTNVPAPDITSPLEERRPGGLGIYLIRQSTDQLLHRLTPAGGNELVLRRRLVVGGGTQ